MPLMRQERVSALFFPGQEVLGFVFSFRTLVTFSFSFSSVCCVPSLGCVFCSFFSSFGRSIILWMMPFFPVGFAGMGGAGGLAGVCVWPGFGAAAGCWGKGAFGTGCGLRGACCWGMALGNG